tara:strand:- start:31 stop:198 length:168 start_codon:yes stop_codon:yes gene_type:complete
MYQQIINGHINQTIDKPEMIRRLSSRAINTDRALAIMAAGGKIFFPYSVYEREAK